MSHPYLYFSKSDTENFKEKIKSSSEAKEKYLEKIKNVSELLKEEFVSEDFANGRNSLHGNFWDLGSQTNRMTAALGTKYLFEKDKECFEKLKALIKHFTSFERWYAESYMKRTPIPWHSDLCSVGMALAISTAYDIIYDDLTAEEQTLYAKKIYELGIKPALSDWVFPETRIHAVDSMGHNWWAVCIGEPAAALLPLKDNLPNENVTAIFDVINKALAAYFSYDGNVLFNKFRNYDKNSLFYESIGYFEYGTGTPLRYLWCYERYFGENRILRDALPDNMADALMSFAYPYTKEGKTEYAFINFGDSGFFDQRTLITKYLIRNGLGTSALRALANTYTTDLWDDIEGYSPVCDNASVDALKKTRVFSSGYVTTRSSWAPDSTMLAIKSGYCWNHSHNDSGTFNITRNGRPFITDCGTCDYDSPLYHAYYCQDCAHNVIRIGNKGRRDEELYRGTKFPGSITDVKEGKDFLFVQADCTGPMAHLCSRLYRNFLWFDNCVLVIFDEIYCHSEDTAEFTLHYMGSCTAKNGKYYIKDDDNEAVLYPVYPEEMKYIEKIGHLDHKQDEDTPYFELQTPEKARKHLLITVLSLGEASENIKIEHVSSKMADGIKIIGIGRERKIWFNHSADGHVMHDNSNNIIDGYDTDAYLMMLSNDNSGNGDEILAVCASYVRKDNKVKLDSFTKTTLIIK